MWRMIPGVRVPLAVLVVATVASLAATPVPPDQASPAPAANPASAAGKAITAAECTAERLGSSIAPSAIGEPVRSVTLSAPSWVESANGAAGALPRERIDGADRYRQHRAGRSISAWCCRRRGRGVRRSSAAAG